MDPRRAQRVAEAMRVELEELINYELSDPRIREVSVTEVLISPDSRRAQVRLHLEGSVDEQRDTLAALEHARHFVRREIGQRLELFKTPDLHFEADLPAEMGNRVGHLLKRVRRGRPRE